ncbi:unnamed protein product [Discula destructiva]
MNQPRRAIEDHGLERYEREGNYPHEYIFLVPFAGPIEEDESDWQCLKLEDPSAGIDTMVDGVMIRARDPWGLHQFAIHSPRKAYVVFSADLRQTVAPFERRTDMRLWEMIAANWMHSGNEPDSLRHVAFSMIINQDVRDAMREEWTHQLAQGQQPFGTRNQRVLTVTPANATTWNSNIFIRTGTHVAESLSTTERPLKLAKAHLIRRPNKERFMVLEFENQDKDQENYRDSLIRQAKPMVTYNLQEKKARRSAGEDWEGITFIPSHICPQMHDL